MKFVTYSFSNQLYQFYVTGLHARIVLELHDTKKNKTHTSLSLGVTIRTPRWPFIHQHPFRLICWIERGGNYKCTSFKEDNRKLKCCPADSWSLIEVQRPAKTNAGRWCGITALRIASGATWLTPFECDPSVAFSYDLTFTLENPTDWTG